MIAQHSIFILFLFAFGACIGSFLNVVVWRLPRGESLVSPPSRCPVCEHRLAWFDNIPVFGWLFLRGRCRYCFSPISAQYPTIEFLTGALLVFYYVMFFIAQRGPCADDFSPQHLSIQQHWPIYALFMFAIVCLFAASLIDLALYIIPIEIPMLIAGVGFAFHAIYVATDPMHIAPGALRLDPTGAAAPMTLGAGIGLLISIFLLVKGYLRRSFADGYPALEVDKLTEEQLNQRGPIMRLLERLVESLRRPLSAEQTATMNEHQARAEAREKRLDEEFKRKHEAASASAPQIREMTKNQIRREMRHEMLFLLIPMVGALLMLLLTRNVGPATRAWNALINYGAANGFLASLFGAMIGALIIWIARILGTLAFGREAMGLGDVHLMFGIGAVVGAGASAVAFFIAPFFGILVAVYMFIMRTRREVPYGPYLGLATAFVMIFYCPIATYLAPGVHGLVEIVRIAIGY